VVQAAKGFDECIHKNPIIAIAAYSPNRNTKNNNKITTIITREKAFKMNTPK